MTQSLTKNKKPGSVIWRDTRVFHQEKRSQRSLAAPPIFKQSAIRHAPPLLLWLATGRVSHGSGFRSLVSGVPTSQLGRFSLRLGSDAEAVVAWRTFPETSPVFFSLRKRFTGGSHQSGPQLSSVKLCDGKSWNRVTHCRDGKFESD